MAKKKTEVDVNEVDEVVSVETKQINEELKSTLEKYPHIDCIWMNEAGNWHFSDKPGFTAYSREEILNG